MIGFGKRRPPKRQAKGTLFCDTNVEAPAKEGDGIPTLPQRYQPSTTFYKAMLEREGWTCIPPDICSDPL